MGELDPRRGALAANEGGDASERRNVIVFPDARIRGRDTPTRLYSRGLHEHKSGACRGAAAEMDQVPIIDEAILGRILAHGRYTDAIAQRDLTNRERSKEHNRKITAPYFRSRIDSHHHASMRQILVGFIAALIAHAASDNGVDLNSKGLDSYRAGRYEEAETWYRKAIEAFTPDQRLGRAMAKENLGVTLRAEGRLAEARDLLETSVKEIQELAGADALETAQAISNLAAIYWSSSDLQKAGELAAQAEAIYASRSGLRLTDRANNRQILSSVYLGQRRYRDALNLLRDSIEFGDDRMKATSYGNLAAASLGLGEIEQAEGYARQGLELADRALPADHPYRAVLLNNLAQTCRFSGNYLEAETHYRAALAIWEKRLGPEHPDVGRGLMNLAAFYHERGREAGAEQLYLRAATLLEKDDPVLALVARSELADVLRTQLRYTESEKLARRTLRLMEGALAHDDPRLIRALTNWATLLNETKRSAEAAKVLAQTSRSLR